MSFDCKKCGICCRHIDKIPQLQCFNKGDGVCIHLKNNLCDIYDKRPLICNIDKMFDLYFANFITKEEFYNLNYQGCKELMEKYKN